MRLMNLDPDTASLSARAESVFVDAIQSALTQAWEQEFWPDLMLIEERYFRPAWAIGTAYTTGSEVYHDGVYYTALQNSTGKDPETETTYWEETEDLDRYVSLDQTGETAIGTVKAASTRNPRVSRYPGFLYFSLSENGLQFTDLAPAEVFIEFRKRVPTFTRTAYVAGTTYAADALVYYATTGEAYKSLQGTNLGKTPGSNPTWWEKIDFPKLLQNAVVWRAYATMLRENGQKEKSARVISEEFDTELARLTRTVFRKQGQYVTARVTTYGS